MTEFDPAYAGTWVIDPAHSRFGFAVKHAMVSKVRGRFDDVSGALEVGEDGLPSARVSVTVPVASINTSHAARDAHLRTNEFFEASKHPEITFRSTQIDQVSDTAFLVIGDLTIKGRPGSMCTRLSSNSSVMRSETSTPPASSGTWKSRPNSRRSMRRVPSNPARRYPS